MDNEEKERLKSLKSYQIMDTEVDEVLDNITALASNICEVPITLISLLDDKRQWFKSKIGLDVSETPRDMAFCRYAVSDKKFLQVKDALDDDRFANNPLVTNDPNIRFYAGCPLISTEGHALGTLCVIDRKPKELTDSQKKALNSLSEIVMCYLNKTREQKKLVDALNIKNDLFQSMSHEIKTPLNEIMGIYYLLKEQKNGENLQKDDLELLKSSAENLFNVISEVLDSGKIYNNHSSDTRILFNLKALLEELITEFRSDTTTLKINYDLAIPDFLVGDPLRLKQLIRLCLKRFGKREINKLILYIELLEEDENSLRIQFTANRADGGEHYTDENDKFNLTFTDQLVNMLDADMQVFRTEINFSLGFNQLEQSASYSKFEQDEEILSGLSLLLVEDMETNRYIAGRFLDSWGIEYDIAHDGFEALKLVGQKKYDIILMDLQMPGMTGYEATEKIKQLEDGKYSSIPVIALTASITILSKGKSIEAGLEGFISKPFNPQELKSTILRVVKRIA
ncbi:response regulator [Fulvivirga ligni]|uniref:response regulator n=1 Tax=Fulvivirga ligni TaxID=2904246 RepID=UPI001F4925E3|nr:response regulator [Fulvivirga ligni]UII21348.1 response regulator [Fulvivirga ligni]